MLDWIRPLACLLVLVLFFINHVLLQRILSGGNGWRRTALEVAVYWGVFVWGTTEFLGLIHQLNLPGLMIMWLASNGVLVAATLRRRSAVLAESMQLAN